MNRKITATLFLCLLTALGFATVNKPMNIKITVKGLENSSMILANYYGDNKYVKDTFYFEKNGSLTIKQDTMYQPGVYLAVFPALGNQFFEFILNEQHFSIETDTMDMIGHLKISGSLENNLFYDDMKFLNKMRKTSDSLGVFQKNATDPKEKDKYLQARIQLEKQIKTTHQGLIDKYPGTFYAMLLKAMKEIEVPEPPRDKNGKILDSAFQWYYYKTHYWDNIDLKDDRILRCPIFHGKLKAFMTQTVVQMPDSINSAGDDLLAKTSIPYGEVYKYVLNYIFNEMASSKVMGFENCYVHFGKKYYCKGLAPWIDSTKMFKICDRVARLEPVLVGKKAQRLILPTDSTERVWKSLYDIKNKYTILVFWASDCSHCKKEIPVLLDAYHNLKKKGIDVEGYAPVIGEMEHYKEWQEFIKNNNLDWINVGDPRRHNNFRYEWDIQSTPQIYILDRDKVIKARRIGAEQVEDFILHLENPAYKGKLTNKVSDTDKQEGTEE